MPPKRNPITREESYIAAMQKPGACSICPCCGAEDPEGDSVDTGDGKASQEMTCNECGAGWHDLYTLTGVDIYQTGSSE